MVGIQRNDGGFVKVCLWQRGGPALQYVFGYQQGRAVFVDGAFGQAIDAPWLVAWPAYAG